MSSEYLLANAATERERLRLQALVWEDAARALFERIPVGRGWKCADIGCGAVGVLRPLSQMVGPDGAVVGVDVDPALLASAKEFVAENRLDNVTLRAANVFEGDLRETDFDLVHLRFMLAPLGRSEALLAAALKLCRPGGIVVLEEPDASCWSLLPPNDAFHRLRDLIVAAFASSGGDFNAGRRTFDLLRAAGAENVGIRAAVHALPPKHPYLRVVIQFATALRRRIVEGGLASDEEIDRLIEEIDGAIGSGAVAGLTFLVTQVWGTKPRRTAEPTHASAAVATEA